MSGQSIGSIVGGIVGAVIGTFAYGNTYAGFVIGSTLGGVAGGALDPPKGPNTKGPRLEDLGQQTATYGAFIPRLYGTVSVFGNVFWLENNKLKEVATTTTSGGKGGAPESSQTTYRYLATFAVGLCEGPIFGIKRIWISGKLWYNKGTVDKSTLFVSNDKETYFRLFLGTETQMPSSRMEADVGVANCPAYRGLAYIVFHGLDLGPYGNSLAGVQVKVEVIKTGSKADILTDIYTVDPLSTYQSSALYIDKNGTATIFNKPTDLNTVSTTQVYTHSIKGAEKILRYISLPHRGIHFSGWADTPCVAMADNSGLVTVMDGKGTIIATINGLNPSQGEITQNMSYYRRADKQFFISVETASTKIYDFNILISTTTAASSHGQINAIFIGQHHHYAFTYTSIFIAYDTDWNQLWTVNMAGAAINLGTPTDGGNDLVVIREETETTAIVKFGQKFWRVTQSGYTIIGTFSVPSAYLGHEYNHYYKGFWFGITATQGNNTDLFVIQFDRITVVSPTLSDIVAAESLNSNLLEASDIDTTQLASTTVRGYKVSSLGAIRSAIEPLQGAYPFDVIQDGYKIKYVKRGGSSVAAITHDKLDARAYGDSPGVQITQMREMDSILPAKVSVKYLDFKREYDTGEQYYERMNTDAINVMDMELPMVLTSAEAAGMAQTLCYLYWLERYDISFTLPPEYNYLQPADVLGLTTPDASYNLRIKQINYTQDGRLEIQAKYNQPAIYTPSSVGEDGNEPPDTLDEFGDTLYELLDIPLIQDIYDMPGFPVAMTGNLEGWPGGVLSRSDDGGATYATIQGFTAPGTTMGYATNTIGTHNGLLLDKASVLNVVLDQGTLSSVTELQLFNGQNHFAYGIDGRWEIIAAQNCALQGDGSYNLSDLMRGRFGTEQYTGVHAVDDKVVYLTSTAMAFVQANSGMIGIARDYKGVTSGDTLDTVTARNFIYKGVNLECLSPVCLKASRSPVSSDITIEWVRRGRVNAEWKDLIDVPVGEATESYEVDIYADNTFAVIKRTLASSAQNATYSAAQQIDDFGGINGDALYNQTVLSLHFNGINGSTTFVDTAYTAPKTPTVNGNAQISATQSKFGGASGYFDGTGDFIAFANDATLSFGSNNFTIEFFCYPTANNGLLLAKTVNNASFGAYELRINASNVVTCYLASLSSSWNIAAGIGTLTVTLNAWNHVALTRNGNTFALFVNGAVSATASSSSALFTNTSALSIGAYNNNVLNYTGYLDDLRITNGSARYTSVFTPPAAQFDDFLPLIALSFKAYQLSATVGRGYPAQATINL